MTARTLLLGDWTPWIRDPIDVLRVLLLAAALVLLAMGDTTARRCSAARARWPGSCGRSSCRAPMTPRSSLALALQAGGEAAGLYDSVPWFDNVTHFSLPFFLAPTLYIALARADLVPDPKDETHLRHYVGMFVVAFSFGVALGGLWEIWEWVSDRTFGSSLQLGVDDTVGDLIADTAGSACGAALLVLWARYGWGSVRRIPGENRYEDTDAP